MVIFKINDDDSNSRTSSTWMECISDDPLNCQSCEVSIYRTLLLSYEQTSNISLKVSHKIVCFFHFHKNAVTKEIAAKEVQLARAKQNYGQLQNQLQSKLKTMAGEVEIIQKQEGELNRGEHYTAFFASVEFLITFLILIFIESFINFSEIQQYSFVGTHKLSSHCLW